MDIGQAILAVASLGFIGLGAKPPTPEWGAMISIARGYLPDWWWYAMAPGVFIYLAVLGFNIYVDRFATVSDTYGVAGSFILLLLGLWLINCALLFGGEFDAELERVCQLYAGVEAERELRLPPRDTRMIHAVDKALEKLVDEGRRMRESASDLARRPGPAAEDDAAV